MTRPGRTAALIFALVWFSCAWFGAWPWNPNTAVRLFGAVSLVEQGDATIDEYGEMTIDKAVFGGHVYPDKAPGMTLMATPAVAIVDAWRGETAQDKPRVFGALPMERYLQARLRLAAATGPALLTAITAVLLFGIGRAVGGGDAAGVVAALGYALGTPAWGWSTTLFGHAPVAALLVIATWAVWRGTQAAAASPRHAALAGVALGWAVVVELPAALFGLVVAFWALWRLRGRADAGRAVGIAVLAGAGALTPLFAYNAFAFGDPFRLGYSGVVGFDGMKQGLFGLTYPKWKALWSVTLGWRRGMIWVAPLIVPGLIGLMLMVRDRTHRDLGALALAMIAIVFLYNASYVYWDGGNSTGPRHSVPALPFLALGLATAWSRAWWAVLPFLAGSIALNAMIAAAEITSGGTGDFPLWSDVIVERFWPGYGRSIGSEYLGLTPWQGFGVWCVVAAAMICALLLALRQVRPSTAEA